MAKQERLNELFHKALSVCLNKELISQEALVTIKSVEFDNNLVKANVFISVIPNKYYGSILKKVRKISKLLAYQAAKKTKISRVPKLYWQIDSSEEKLSELDKIFQQIENEKK